MISCAMEIVSVSSNGTALSASSENVPCSENLPLDGSEWVELLVNEMASASNMDDAKACASRALEVFEKAVISRVSAQASHGFQKENIVLKEQLESLTRENAILKRAFAIQHERQKDYDEKNQELHQLKQFVSQYQEQVRNLEEEKAEQGSRPERKQEARPRFAPEFDGINCFESIVSF